MPANTRTAYDGARIYGRWLLAIYDVLIMRILTPYVWRCRAEEYVSLYHQHMSANHADIGVGTGYCLDRSRFSPGQVRIALIDLQQNCLRFTSRRLQRFKPECYQRNALDAIHIDQPCFDSIGLGGLLHCIPGDMQAKARVFDAIRPITKPSTCVFGYTILNQGVRKTWLSRIAYFIFQKLKVINGIDDCAKDLQAQLQTRFRYSHVRVIGCVAIFVAEEPIVSN